MRNDISNIILQEIALFFDMMLSFSQVNFLGICSHSQLLCVVWVLDVMNIFESLVVLNIELNLTLELMGLAYSQEFDNIFAPVVKSHRRCHAMTENSVIVHEMNVGLFLWGKWGWNESPRIKYFGSLIIFLELADISLLLVKLSDA